MKNVSFGRLILIAVLALSQFSTARAEGSDAFQFFQEEAKVAIATQHEQTVEQAPNIVSVVTRRDIEAYGARDLADILRRVPGFDFGVDVFSVVGLSVRGIWAVEAKALVMINGVTVNDYAFGNTNFFGTIPSSIIEKVEIIRGPGSALYGGFAEVTTINVITRQPESLHGMLLSGDVGGMGDGNFARHGNISYGQATDTMKVALHVGYGEEPLSKRDYVDSSGNRLKLNEDTSSRQWQHVITEASSNNFTLRYNRTSFTYMGQDGFGAVIPPANGINAERQNNASDTVNLKYQAKVSERLTIEPVVEFNRSNTETTALLPSSVIGSFEGPGSTLWHYQAQLCAVYDTPFEGQLTAGGGLIRDRIENIQSDGTPGVQLSADPNDLATSLQKDSRFALVQYTQKWNNFGFTSGARYEDTAFGSAAAPRAGITYAREAFNAKLLYGRAYRIPLLWEAYLRGSFSGGIEPEIADTTEMELGYKFTPHLSAKTNLFFINITKPLVFVGQTNSFVNAGKNQSEGAESELKLSYAHWGGFANASYATPGPDTSSAFRTASKKQFIGISPFIANLGSYYRSGMMEYAPSITYLSHRAGQSPESALAGTEDTIDYKALALVNFNIIAHDVLRDLDVNFSVHNLFDTPYVLLQPFYGGHAPLPAQDRQFMLGVTWHL
jgi:outer membrane cobalamin receptor